MVFNELFIKASQKLYPLNLTNINYFNFLYHGEKYCIYLQIKSYVLIFIFFIPSKCQIPISHFYQSFIVSMKQVRNMPFFSFSSIQKDIRESFFICLPFSIWYFFPENRVIIEGVNHLTNRIVYIFESIKVRDIIFYKLQHYKKTAFEYFLFFKELKYLK